MPSAQHCWEPVLPTADAQWLVSSNRELQIGIDMVDIHLYKYNMYMYMYMHMHMDMYMYIYIYTHTYTYTRKFSASSNTMPKSVSRVVC